MIRGAEFVAYPSPLPPPERAETSSRAADRRPDDGIDWALVDDDLDAVRHSKVNLLLIGPECLVMNVIRRAIADVPATIVIPCETGRLPLSHRSLPPGTLVLRDVDALDAAGQAFVFDWLEGASSERQIVSTASTSLLPLVDAGVFDRRLYYRLNTVYIRLG